MRFELTDEDVAYVERFRGYLDGLAEGGFVPPSGMHAPDHPVSDEHRAFRAAFLRRLGADGWWTVSDPDEPHDRSALERWLMFETMAERGLPTMIIGLTIVANALVRVGTDEQKRTLLPQILAGEVQFCLGYTEPGAGSDLASLRTRADRDDQGNYVINGQKVYTTGAEYASHVWLAARTSRDEASPHRGISLFIVPLDTPGITMRPLITLADYRTNEVFYDNVVIPESALVGSEGDGWRILAMALDFERAPQASGHVVSLGRAIEWLAQARDEAGEPLLDDPAVREDIAALAVRAEVARLMSLRMADMYQHGETPNVEASSTKVWHTEYHQDSASTVLSILGEAGQFVFGDPGAVTGGQQELRFRESAVQRISAGTNEVQRDIIAQRGLGLPRNRRR